MTDLEIILDIPESMLMDDNHPEAIKLPEGMCELVLSSSPQFTLYRLVRHIKPRSILEIGTQIGASAIAMALGMRDNKIPVDVICIDPFLKTGDNDGWPTLQAYYTNIVNSTFQREIQLLLTTADKAIHYLQKQFDLVIIDGSHQYRDVKHDFLAALKMTPQGGYIWLHDYMIYQTVRNACNDVVRRHQLPASVNPYQRNDRNDLCGWMIARNLPFHMPRTQLVVPKEVS